MLIFFVLHFYLYLYLYLYLCLNLYLYLYLYLYYCYICILFTVQANQSKIPEHRKQNMVRSMPGWTIVIPCHSETTVYLYVFLNRWFLHTHARTTHASTRNTHTHAHDTRHNAPHRTLLICLIRQADLLRPKIGRPRISALEVRINMI
jgi:hypothetical protein